MGPFVNSRRSSIAYGGAGAAVTVSLRGSSIVFFPTTASPMSVKGSGCTTGAYPMRFGPLLLGRKPAWNADGRSSSSKHDTRPSANRQMPDCLTGSAGTRSAVPDLPR
mmetsp:Transcript_47274/g.119885  ORF Transcript_47274/g.119885 Transcript_47274/m.119885 type:complete len:108 (-) Transcript_47274:36-359(-)